MEQGTNRLFGAFNHCDPLDVACKHPYLSSKKIKSDFSQQEAFLNEAVALLSEQGRDVYPSTARKGLYETYMKVPAIRERRNNLPSKLTSLIPGKVLYKLGDAFTEVVDSQVRDALMKAEKKHPYQHRAQMPLGAPL